MQRLDRRVEIAMFDPQHFEALDHLGIVHVLRPSVQAGIGSVKRGPDRPVAGGIGFAANPSHGACKIGSMCLDDNCGGPAALSRNRCGEGRRSLWGRTEGKLPMEQSHLSALQVKHAGLERRIDDEQGRPMPDHAAIQAIKKRKLRIKEELQHS